jgi:hypothetical protein
MKWCKSPGNPALRFHSHLGGIPVTPRQKVAALTDRQQESWGPNQTSVSYLARQIRGLLKFVEILSEQPAGAYLPRLRMKAELRSVLDAVEAARFTAACEECQGEGCFKCHETGSITKQVASNLTKARIPG